MPLCVRVGVCQINLWVFNIRIINSFQGKTSPIYLRIHKFFSTAMQAPCTLPVNYCFPFPSRALRKKAVSRFINLKFGRKEIPADQNYKVNLCRYYIMNEMYFPSVPF